MSVYERLMSLVTRTPLTLGLFRISTKYIPPPILSKVGLNSSKTRQEYPFCNHSCLADAELPTSKWSKSFDKFDVVLDVKYSASAGGVYTSSSNPKASA